MRTTASSYSNTVASPNTGPTRSSWPSAGQYAELFNLQAPTLANIPTLRLHPEGRTRASAAPSANSHAPALGLHPAAHDVLLVVGLPTDYPARGGELGVDRT